MVCLKVYCGSSVWVKGFIAHTFSSCVLPVKCLWAQFKNKKVIAYFFLPVLQTPSAI